MKRNFILLFSVIFLAFACGGSGGSGSSSSSDGSSIQPIIPGPDNPGDGNDPGDGDDGDDGQAQVYDFGGEYSGPCSVKASIVTSSDCNANMNIYHEEGGITFGFMGLLNVKTLFGDFTYPVSSKTLGIRDGVLFDPETGEDLGDINSSGFTVSQPNGDTMRFDRTPSGGFDYTGTYQDATYGTVSIEGSLEKLEE